MHEMIPRVVAALRSGEPVAIASVVERRGSLPMASDACMIVTAAGEAAGTVGGGCLEAEVYAIARGLLERGGVSVDRFRLTEVEEGLGGHVCGGSVAVLTRALQPDEPTREVFEALAEAIERGGATALATAVPGADVEASTGPLLACCDRERVLAGGARIPGGVLVAARAALDERSVTRAPAGDAQREWIVEPLPGQPRVVIFGAGHCGRAIGKLAASVGFRVTVLEDRPGFLDADAMPWAEELRPVRFDALDLPLVADEAPYLVIVTRGHEHDLAILRQVVHLPAAYLGMIGSERKRHLFARTLGDEGIPASELARLCSPMGLRIGADTPEEIAVSVVGEMIAVRRRGDLEPSLRSGRSSRRRAAGA